MPARGVLSSAAADTGAAVVLLRRRRQRRGHLSQLAVAGATPASTNVATGTPTHSVADSKHFSPLPTLRALTAPARSHHSLECSTVTPKPGTGANVGGVLGALVALALFALGLPLCLRRWRRAKQRESFAGGMPATLALPWQSAPGASAVDTETDPERLVPSYGLRFGALPMLHSLRHCARCRRAR
jgi:hypothetical protein